MSTRLRPGGLPPNGPGGSSLLRQPPVESPPLPLPVAGHGFARAAGAVALAGAALWTVTRAGAALLAASQAAPPTAPQLLALLGSLVPLVVMPALGGVWLLRGSHRRAQAGAALVAATGLLVTVTVPAVLARVFAASVTWGLLDLAAVGVIALAGGLAVAALLHSPEVGCVFPVTRRTTCPVARLALLAGTLMVTVTVQPPLREVVGLILTDGWQAGVAALQELPVSMHGLILTGVAAVAATGIGAASLRPCPCRGCRGGSGPRFRKSRLCPQRGGRAGRCLVLAPRRRRGHARCQRRCDERVHTARNCCDRQLNLRQPGDGELAPDRSGHVIPRRAVGCRHREPGQPDMGEVR